MKQVLFRRGQVVIDEVPSPSIIDNHVLVEVAYSLISAGTEISNLEHSQKSIFQQAIEQPEKIKKSIGFFLFQRAYLRRLVHGTPPFLSQMTT